MLSLFRNIAENKESMENNIALYGQEHVEFVLVIVHNMLKVFLMSVLVSFITSNPYSSLGSTKHLIMCIN
jgi:hypothetical protein